MDSTGLVESWQADPTTLGPLYPFAGWEVAMVAACLLFCIAFLVWKFWTEHAKYVAKVKHLHQPGELADALSLGGVADARSQASR